MTENNPSTENKQQANQQTSNQQMDVRMEKLDKLRLDRDPFEEVTYDVTHHANEIIEQFEELEGKVVRLAGRLMSKRGMGKASFCDLMDSSGRVQTFTKFDVLGEEAYQKWQTLDLGDIVGIEGEVMRTNRGEISIRNLSYTLLAKCVRPLPDKYHGLKDTDTRYRQRYLDLMMNPEVRKTFETRSRIIHTMRDFLHRRDFLEVETPILNTIPGGAAARPFVTHHNALDLDLYLRIAPELYLKRLIVGGFDRVFEIGRNFRNEGTSVRHNPEFSMIELYQAYTDYHGMMELTESMIEEICQTIHGTNVISYDGTELNFSTPFKRLSMRDAVLEHTGIDFYAVSSFEEAKALAEERGLEVMPGWQRGDIFNLFFETYAEDKLIQPTFIYDYPIEVSPLTKKKPGHPELTERFELFVHGNELANAYSELNDPVDQRERFRAQLAKREAGDDEANRMDEDYCVALEYGLPPTGGMGMGIDRLSMLMTNSVSIRDVLLFPTMRPIGHQEKSED